MSRGRKRKLDPTIPTHIAQEKIPAGLYWHGRGRGRWYVFDVDAAGKRTSKVVAGRDALLSDLHRIAEQRAGAPDRESLRGLAAAFASSPQFHELAKATRVDYDYCRNMVLEHPTKLGRPFGDLATRKLTRPLIQLLIDALASGTKRDAAGDRIPTPSKAAHAQRYLGRLFEWGINRGFAIENPAAGVELPTERKRRTMPEAAVMERLIQFARVNAGGRGIADSVAPYLAPALEIAYLCRLRGIELLDLTDASLQQDGLACVRRKGSRENCTAWSPRLRAACEALAAYRAKRWAKRGTPTPIAASSRPLLVAIDGGPLSKSALDSAWQRLMALAIARDVLSREQRFGLHGLKRRGITDTEGTSADKQLASGHRSEAMVQIYDQSIALVQPAGATKPHKIPPAKP
jgi:site-specific recombinase XerC